MTINFSFFFTVAFALILFQTVLLPGTVLFTHSFDTLMIVILYMSIVFSHHGVVAAIVVLGGIMDSISGSPFFIHMFSYIWVYIIVQMFRQFVFHGSSLFIIIVSMAGVTVEQMLLLFSVFISQGTAGMSEIDYLMPVKQIVWGGICIPAGVWVLSLLRQNWTVAGRQLGRAISRKING